MPMPQLTPVTPTTSAKPSVPTSNSAVVPATAVLSPSFDDDIVQEVVDETENEAVVAEMKEPEPPEPESEPDPKAQLWEQLLGDMPVPVRNVLWEMGLNLDSLLQCSPAQLLGSLEPRYVQTLEAWLKAHGHSLQKSPEPVDKPKGRPKLDGGKSTYQQRLIKRLERFKRITKV